MVNSESLSQSDTHNNTQDRSAAYSARLERLLGLGMIANGIVHDLANPLNAVVMNAELGLAYLALEPQQGQAHEELKTILSTIIRETKRAGTLTQSVTEFTRTDDYAPSHVVDLIDVIAKARDLLGSKLRRSDVELLMPTNATVAKVSAKPLALALALASLIDIAIESGSARVQIALAQSTSDLILTVTNESSLTLSTRTLSTSPSAQALIALVERILAAHQASLSITDNSFSIRFASIAQIIESA